MIDYIESERRIKYLVLFVYLSIYAVGFATGVAVAYLVWGLR